MRKQIILIFLLILSITAKSQENMLQKERGKIDSIIHLVAEAKEENKKVDLLLSIYVSIDAYPVLLLEVSQKLYVLSQNKKDVILESSAWSAAGQGYRLAGNYVKGLECNQRAVNLALQSGNDQLLRFAQNQMANIYKDRLENEKALALYRAAGGLTEKNKDHFKNWWAPMNMAAVYLNMGKLDSSLYCSMQSLDLFPKETRPNLIYVFSNIATVYSKKNNPAKAREYFSKALALAEKFNSPRFYNLTYVDIAEHFYRNHQPDSCIYYAKKAVEVVRNTMISNLALKPARLLAEMYQNHNADSAAKYWKVYIVANDSLNNARANQQLMMMAFEEEQRKRDIENEKISYRNKIKTNLILGGLGVALLITLILYRNNRQKQKANKVLETTLANLKSAQSQLVHAEKMASLGELTAGIAHEIQNPLNFINNFSEVNKEMIAEMKEEINKGNYSEVKIIADDIEANEEKINHHGKRADAIVKGMLQHSRSSNGQKELTDINALADEYLRLSYHGLRAKDKSFNAKFETSFDNSIDKINVVPQDIGRVILNLINNAFYAVSEKAKQNISGYEPTVTVSTKKENGKVVISVKDNGNGIPDSIKEKIFQPFFTTKPTGSGTGLGLSLSYDIIKSHGGVLSVESIVNEQTKFTINLPLT
ncbi:MAG TPA: ATP-binding protein [Chitinophagaceae bacterium]|nr:ATP-binding protein [Chitinophagaceae bacterium]